MVSNQINWLGGGPFISINSFENILQILPIFHHFLTISWQSCKIKLDFPTKNIFVVIPNLNFRKNNLYINRTLLLPNCLFHLFSYPHLPVFLFIPYTNALSGKWRSGRMCHTDEMLGLSTMGPLSSWDDLLWYSAGGTHTDLLKRWVLAVIYSLHPRQSLLTSYKRNSAHSFNISVAWCQNAAGRCQHGKETYVNRAKAQHTLNTEKGVGQLKKEKANCSRS